jgi:L-asparaginase II
VIESVSESVIGEDRVAIDGCSVPTWALPLTDLARAFARFGTGQSLPPKRAEAARRLRAACASEPWFVAGSGRFCSEVMSHFGERVFVKTGAEGVFCAALPEQGLGLALKCDDGATRAAEIVMAAMIARYATLANADRVLLERLMRPTLRNWNGTAIGTLRPAAALKPPSAQGGD